MAEKTVMDERHLTFFKSHGYLKADEAAGIKEGTVEDAQKMFDAMSKKDKASFLADFEKSLAPAPPEGAGPAAARPSSARTAEERDGKPAKKYKVLRHLQHNDTLHKPGTILSEEQFTPAQIKPLLETGTMEEHVEEEKEEAAEE